MNIGSFLQNGRALYGVFIEGGVRPVGADVQARFPTLRDLLDAGDVDLLRDGSNLSETLHLGEITFLQPIPNPRKIICVGLNYPKPYPVDGVVPPKPDNIILFGKERDTLVPHHAALEMPMGAPSRSFDYEGEIAVVIGKAARHVSHADALNSVLGYSIFNDGSVREWQKHSIYAGKNFANSGSWGPWITTADALAPVEDLQLTVALNGDTVQCAFGRDMIFTLAAQISYASSLFCLHPGDIIATGSPDGTGGSRTPRRFLLPGDHLSISVSGIGSLENTVTKTSSS
ncbi:fumarylacetoacetate hydrolase family protein [uncultured Sulfitobacter sp.]|uniref:fumarylacetoacetate hydrolase family protein n=1 Tax=uncultured Sulfitobacter sp. TaxID=191468 RepID=UPI00260A0D81|nr:fumarylacetoacetate hydrolase family protein [uncultured Sulfitobacter sp.]